MCRVALLQLMATLVVACSCISVDRSIAEGRGRRPMAAVINIPDQGGNASDPEAAIIKIPDYGGNASSPVVANINIPDQAGNASSSVVATINVPDKGGNASSPEATAINISNQAGNASGSINVNASVRGLVDEKAREVGGQITSNTQAVIWQRPLVALMSPRKYLCTGTVIGRDTVLTSYNCVRRYSKGRLMVSEAQEILLDSYLFTDVAHMNLNEGLDLAVLKMEEEEFFTQSSVSKLIDDSDTLVTGDKCTVSGWLYGSDEEKNEWQIQNVSYMSSEDCINAYSSVASPINESMICANPEVGDSSCTNIGWPLFCNGELAGLYSWTYFSCVHPGVYSSMKVSAPWISEATTSGVASVVINLFVTIASVLLWCNFVFAISR